MLQYSLLYFYCKNHFQFKKKVLFEKTLYFFAISFLLSHILCLHIWIQHYYMSFLCLLGTQYA